MNWLRRHRVPLFLFAAGLIVFAAVSGNRLTRQSSDPHFVLQADAWLNGRLDIAADKRRGDDWAVVETATLDDGQTVRGRRLSTRSMFRVAGGEEVPMARVQIGKERQYLVSFPPFPAVIMLPIAAIWGPRGNDVVPTVIIAALILPLAFLTLRRLAQAGQSARSAGDDVWLCLALGFGSVLFFSAVQGRVWFSAHVVGVFLALAYVWAAIEAKHPVLAGLCLALATMTRVPMAFMFPLFLLEAWRMRGSAAASSVMVKRVLCFAAPIVAVAAIAMVHNYVRFGEVGEFGHTYLAVRQQRQIETIGMFSGQYLSRNLAVALALLPSLSLSPPYVSISGHGLALWFTMPFLLLLLWPKQKPPIHRSLWLCVALVAVPTLLYQNSGWFQFGYRFCLDYVVLLFLLLAVGGQPFGRLAKGLMVAAIAINLFGALTFARHHQFYRTDASTYRMVIPH